MRHGSWRGKVLVCYVLGVNRGEERRSMRWGKNGGTLASDRSVRYGIKFLVL
jgi:hypothetical protein